MNAFEFKSAPRTLPLPAQTEAAGDPITAATHPSDRKSLAKLTDQGWELYDVQSAEYRLRRRLGTGAATGSTTTPADAS